MRQKPFRSIWIIFLFIFVFILAACGSEIPTVEQPLPEQSEATSLPTDVLPTTEPTREPEATPTTETSEKTPEISQPIARWNAVTEAGNWILIGYGDVLNPTVVEPGTYVTINFSTIDDQVTGSGGCNDFTSSYIADDDGNLTVNGPVGTTLIACEIGMEQEGIFIGALESVTAYTVTERGNLLLDYDSGTVYDEQLVFIPERPLVDTVWVLNAYGDPNDLTLSAPGVMTTAMFSGIGTLNGYTGCNNYIASYSVNENQILVDIPMTNLAACGIGMKQEQAFMQLLSAAQSYRLGYNTLEISTVDGSVLRFSAQQLSLENVRWSLTAVDGQEVPDHVTINALFTPADSPAAQKAENSVEGTAGCNAFFGAYTVTGDELTISSIGSTRMFCDDLVMQLEQAFLTGMEGAQSYQFVGGQLLIDTGAGLLTFEADRIPLEGPNWILTGSGPLADPQPPIPGAIFTANFSRQFGMPTGVKTGGTGCNDYTVAYFAASDPIKLNLPQTTQITCSDAQTESEQGYFLSLNAARDYRI